MKDARRQLRRCLVVPALFALRLRPRLRLLLLLSVLLLPLLFLWHPRQVSNPYLYLPPRHVPFSALDPPNVVVTDNTASLAVVIAASHVNHSIAANLTLLLSCDPASSTLLPDIITLCVTGTGFKNPVPLLNLAAAVARTQYLLLVSDPSVLPTLAPALPAAELKIWGAFEALLVQRTVFLSGGGAHEGMPSLASALAHFARTYQSISSGPDVPLPPAVDVPVDEVPTAPRPARFFLRRAAPRRLDFDMLSEPGEPQEEMRTRLAIVARAQAVHAATGLPLRVGVELPSTALYHPAATTSGFVLLRPRHGLANRLRALASGLALASATGRVLLVDWRPDEHCPAELPVFLRARDGQLEVRNTSAGFAAFFFAGRGEYTPARRPRLWAGASDRELPGVPWGATTAALRSLVFAHSLVDTERARLAHSLCVHVRHADYTTDVPGASAEYAQDADIGQLFRSLSAPAILAPHAAHLAAQLTVHDVFVAADKATHAEQLRTLLAPSLQVWTLAKPNGCEHGERAGPCARTALADLVALGSGACRVLIGSAYSSFTDVAARLAGVRPVLPGFDFAQQDLQTKLQDASQDTRRRVQKMVARHHRNERTRHGRKRSRSRRYRAEAALNVAR